MKPSLRVRPSRTARREFVNRPSSPNICTDVVFSTTEQELLIRLIYTRIYDVELGTERSAGARLKAEEAWEAIEKSFNESDRSTHKATQKDLRTLWTQLKNKMKQKRKLLGAEARLNHRLLFAVERMLQMVDNKKVESNNPSDGDDGDSDDCGIVNVINESGPSTNPARQNRPPRIEPSASPEMHTMIGQSLGNKPAAKAQKASRTSVNSMSSPYYQATLATVNGSEPTKTIGSPSRDKPTTNEGKRRSSLVPDAELSTRRSARTLRPKINPAAPPDRQSQIVPPTVVLRHTTAVSSRGNSVGAHEQSADQPQKHPGQSYGTRPTASAQTVHEASKTPASPGSSLGVMEESRPPFRFRGKLQLKSPSNDNSPRPQSLIARSPFLTGVEGSSQIYGLHEAKIQWDFKHFESMSALELALMEKKMENENIMTDMAKEVHEAKMRSSAIFFEKKIAMDQKLQSREEELHLTKLRHEELSGKMQRELQTIKIDTAKIEQRQAEINQRILELRLIHAEVELRRLQQDDLQLYDR